MKTATIPQRNQRLYKCWNGELETVVFLQRMRLIAHGTAEMWLVFDPKAGHRRFVQKDDGYFTTPYLAWKAELKSHQDGLKAQRVALKKAKATIARLKDIVARLKDST